MKQTLSLIIVLFFMVTASAVNAAEYLLQQSTYKKLTAAQELMEKERYLEAEQSLKQLLSETKEASYDRAVVQQTLGYIYSSTEQYSQAAKLFKQALESEALPEQVNHNLRFNLAQLLIMQEQYKQGIALLKLWLQKEPSAAADAHVLMANAYYQLENYQQVARHLDIAIRQTASPQEIWYQLLMAAHMELKQYNSAITVLETLISDFPYNKLYWGQLSALYLQQNKELTALAVSRLLQKIELTDSRVLLSLADMYRYLHIPYKSAQLLADGMEKQIIAVNEANLNRLANSWIAAREPEKAVQVLQKLAQSDNSGEADLKLGRVLYELDQWQQAYTVLSRSLSELKGKQKGAAVLLAAMAKFHLGQYEQAISLFEQASNYQTQRNQAQFWLDYTQQLQLTEGNG